MGQSRLQSTIELIVTNGLGFERIREEESKWIEKERTEYSRFFNPRKETVESNKYRLKSHLAFMESRLTENYIDNGILAIQNSSNHSEIRLINGQSITPLDMCERVTTYNERKQHRDWYKLSYVRQAVNNSLLKDLIRGRVEPKGIFDMVEVNLIHLLETDGKKY